jgi:dimethylamine monooxygenase subunit A
MLPDFPFDYDEYDMPMNLKALASDCIVEIDDRYQAETSLKARILASDHRYYCQATACSEPLQWEAVQLLLSNMARHYPHYFSLRMDGQRMCWINRLLDMETRLTLGDVESMPPCGPGDDRLTRPLDWIGRQVQEDLLLVSGEPDGGTPLVAGQLCFAGSWCLDDKMGKSFLAIHHEVPQFADRIGRSADMAMQRLKPDRLVGRSNWNIVASDRLNCAPATLSEWIHSRRGITIRNAGERCFLRLEWQTLSRLPETRGALFTIHTTLQPIASVVASAERLRRLTSVVKGIPRPTREYKNMAVFADTLIEYLEAQGREASGQPASTAHRMADRAEDQALTASKLDIFSATDGECVEAAEPYVLPTTQVIAGDPRATIRVLRRNEQNAPLYLAGIVTVQPSTIRRVNLANETCSVLTGRARLTRDDGETVLIGPGTMISLSPDTVWTWEIVEPLRYSLVMTM